MLTKQFYFLLFSFLLSHVTLFATPISLETAKEVATNFYLSKVNIQSSGRNVSVVLTHQEKAVVIDNQIQKTPTVLYFVFNVDNQGFVIVSGDDRLIPIIAYSTESQFQTQDMPIHISKWFEQYKSEIRYVLDNKIPADKNIEQQWETLKSGISTNDSNNRFQRVDPLLKTKWNQSPYYNDKCPYDSNAGERAVTGCVATAMAQVMKYWDYPSRGTGYHSYFSDVYGIQAANFGATSYAWGSMPNVVSSRNDAVATLMYHCGVSVDMKYGIGARGGSAAQTLDVADALKLFFGYAQSTKGIARKDYSDVTWEQLLKNELDAGRPIQYAGTGSGGGHSFVCDGYDENDYLHFNWGWGGMDDGFFWINALNPESLGTGGGTGNFNSNHRAIIGIQPPSNSPPAVNIDLYSTISVSPNPIRFGESFTVRADIINRGSSTFYGSITAALFDDEGNFIDYIDILEETNGLRPNYHYTNGLNFTTDEIVAAPGDYVVGIYVKPNNDWIAVGNGNYTNFFPVTIVYSNDIELYADIIPSGNPLIQNQPASFKMDIANFGSSNFSGTFSIDLHDLEGNWIETLQELTGMSLCSNCHYQNGLTFSVSNLNIEPGSYLLAVWERPNGGDWDLVGSTSYRNPVQITIAEPQISPDIFENNNTQNSAYNLPLSFANNTANLKTTGSNIHVGNDYDFYKVVLPSGYNYTIIPRVHDSFNSGNGLSYTNDVLFSYNINGGAWSDAYDDVINGSINVSGNNILLFQVSPYFQGQTGTYLLQIQINRSPITSSHEIEEEYSITVFPNPVGEILNVESAETEIRSLSICDISGKMVLKSFQSKQINVAFLEEGSYVIILETDRGFVRKRFIKIKN